MYVVMDDLDAIIEKGRTNTYTKSDKQILKYLAKQNANPILKQIVQDDYRLKQSFLVRTRQLNNTPSKIQSIWDKIIADLDDGTSRCVLAFSCGRTGSIFEFETPSQKIPVRSRGIQRSGESEKN